MVRSIGIDPGDRTVKVVELDGSYRKTRLLRVYTAPVGSAIDDPMRPDIVAEAARSAIDGVDGVGAMKGEVTLGHPCREAVLRSLELPFKGTDAIKKVVKSEIEGEIYTHSVDEMVVDFHEIGPGASGGTRILVASVPKVGLRNQLTSLSAQGIEPEVIDLDTMALWRVSDWAGAFDVDEDDVEDGRADGGDRVTAVVDLGARSVKVILVEGENLVEMRALRLGDSTVADNIARDYGLPFAEARDAVERSLRSGEDIEVTIATDLTVGVEAAGGAADDAASAGELAELPSDQQNAVATTGRAIIIPHAAVEAAHTKYLQRLARELTRFMTAAGMASQVRSLWMTGGASRGHGISEMLTAVFGLEPKELNVLAHLQHDLEPQEAADLGPCLATAVGLALGRLGGPEGFQMRQEDLVLTRGFERIKFPLAIVCMVALLALFVHINRRSMELRNLEYEIGQRYDSGNPKDVIFHGLLNPIFGDKWLEDEQNFLLEQGSKRYRYRDLVDEVTAAPIHDRVRIVRDRLDDVAAQKQKKSGIYEDVRLESGLAVLVRWAEILKGVEPQLGRYLVMRIGLKMDARNRSSLEFRVAFRGRDFRSRLEALEAAIKADFAKRDSPFEAPEKGEMSVGDLFQDRDSKDKGVEGSYFTVTIPIKDTFPAFPAIGQSVGRAAPPGSPQAGSVEVSGLPVAPVAAMEAGR